MTRAYTVEVQTASVFYAQSLILLLFVSIDPLLSLEAVKHGHTISAVGVEPCTGRLYFSGGERERMVQGSFHLETGLKGLFRGF